MEDINNDNNKYLPSTQDVCEYCGLLHPCQCETPEAGQDEEMDEVEDEEREAAMLLAEQADIEYVGTRLPPQRRLTAQDYLDDEERSSPKHRGQERMQKQRGLQRTTMLCEEDFEEVEKPDMWLYLSSFGLSEQQMIGVCRTFANYLAQRVRIGEQSKTQSNGRSRKSNGTTKTAAARGAGSKRSRVEIDLIDDE